MYLFVVITIILMLLPFQGVFFLCPITQGAASLYPGLCTAALTARAGLLLLIRRVSLRFTQGYVLLPLLGVHCLHS